MKVGRWETGVASVGINMTPVTLILSVLVV
jgi:hypothetical protein